MVVERVLIADLFSRLPPMEQHFASRVLGGCPRLGLRAGESRGASDFEGSALLVVERGAVAIVSEPRTGRRIVATIAGPGELLPVPAREQRLLALEHAGVVAVTVEARRRLLSRPVAAEAIADDLLERLRECEDSLAQFGSVAHVERVHRKLLQLARLHGTRVDGGVRVELPLTHALIAEMVGSARETVSGAVRALERDGLLVREDGRYRLLAPADPSKLV
jgi:CRP/FNR family transcriptional regulator, cyclic AMP receptor protein